MIPPTPITTMPASKAKIGFSIDSIVGDEIIKSPRGLKHNDYKYISTNDCQSEISRAIHITDNIHTDTHKFRQEHDIKELRKDIPNLLEFSIHHRESSNSPSSYVHQQHQHQQHQQQHQQQQQQHQQQQHQLQQQQQQQHEQQQQQQQHEQHQHQHQQQHLHHHQQQQQQQQLLQQHQQQQQQAHIPSDSDSINKSRSPSPHRTESLKFHSPPAASINHNTPIRPLPLVPQNLVETKTLPPYLNIPALSAPHNQHILQAQFQMAAALAQRQAEQGFSTAAKFIHHPPPQLVNPNMPRDSYPLYPWLISRHGRIFPHGFPGNFLLHPFRKPKRVRTAFSPSQLLKLEHAFESNQYVVGAERKALAQALNLSETQVKVWFQNRRTKHKRMQQEEESKGSNGNSANSINNDGSGHSYDEDEMIDMDDCLTDEEGD